jgi:hypothetical protein
MLEAHDLGQYWQDPGRVGEMSKAEWAELVANAVEEREGREREKRFEGMSSEASRRYERVKGWGPVTKEAHAAFSGEVGRRGARFHESYLDDHCESVGRKLKMLCRAGCLPLMDRVGQEMGWSDSLRTCVLCDTGEAETLEHFIMTCPAHQKQRETMVRGVSGGTGGVGVAIAAMPLREQCDLLLGRSTGTVSLDKWIDTLFKRFARKAWSGRGRAARAVQEVTEVGGPLWELGRVAGAA